MALLDFSYPANDAYCDNTAPPQDICYRSTPLVRCRGYCRFYRFSILFVYSTGGVQSLLSVFVAVKHFATNLHSPLGAHCILKDTPEGSRSFDTRLSPVARIFYQYHAYRSHGVHIQTNFVQRARCACCSLVQCIGDSTKQWLHTIVLLVPEHWDRRCLYVCLPALIAPLLTEPPQSFGLGKPTGNVQTTATMQALMPLPSFKIGTAGVQTTFLPPQLTLAAAKKIALVTHMISVATKIRAFTSTSSSLDGLLVQREEARSYLLQPSVVRLLLLHRRTPRRRQMQLLLVSPCLILS